MVQKVCYRHVELTTPNSFEVALPTSCLAIKIVNYFLAEMKDVDNMITFFNKRKVKNNDSKIKYK
jgi:hypothetical protein